MQPTRASASCERQGHAQPAQRKDMEVSTGDNNIIMPRQDRAAQPVTAATSEMPV